MLQLSLMCVGGQAFFQEITGKDDVIFGN